MAMAAAAAVMRRLDIDLRQRAHGDEAKKYERHAREQRVSKRSRLEQHADVVGPDEQQSKCHEDRKATEDVRAHSLWRCERLDIPLDAESLTDRLRDRIEHLRKAAADLVLNVDRRDNELQVVRGVSRGQSFERIFLGSTETDLAADEEEG